MTGQLILAAALWIASHAQPHDPLAYYSQPAPKLTRVIVDGRTYYAERVYPIAGVTLAYRLWRDGRGVDIQAQHYCEYSEDAIDTIGPGPEVER